MDWSILFLIYVVALVFLLFLGYWVPFSLGTVGLVGLLILGDPISFQALGSIAWNGINSFEITAIPLFILMGDIIVKSGISSRFFHGASIFLRKLPGGLLQTNIISCTFFSAVSGSSLATAATVGSVAVPELKKRGYNRPMIFGSLGGGGALGLLIPPSIPLIIYGAMVEESVSKLFIAGLIPGILAAIIFMIYIGVRASINPKLVPQKSNESYTIKDKINGIFGVLPLIILIIAIIGGIYSGLTTPTEAAGLGVVLALILSMIYKQFNFENIKDSLLSTVRTSSMIFLIVIGAETLSYLIVKSGINRGLTSWISTMDPDPIMFLIIITIMYLIIGCIIDGISIIFLTLPVLWPLIELMGYDPIWFGIYLVILIEISQITPPVGINLFVLQGATGEEESLAEIIRGNIPYFFLYLFVALLIAIFPQLALWLPSLM